jgi:hypothetical protein
VWVFKKYHTIKAGYLTWGGASGKILSMGSDFDFVVIKDNIIWI